MTDYSFSNLTEVFESFRAQNKTKKMYPILASVVLIDDKNDVYYVEHTTFGINPLVVLKRDGSELLMTIENIEKRNSTGWEKWTFNNDGLSVRRAIDKLTKAASRADHVKVLTYAFVFPMIAEVSEQYGVWTWKNGSLICEKRSFIHNDRPMIYKPQPYAYRRKSSCENITP